MSPNVQATTVRLALGGELRRRIAGIDTGTGDVIEHPDIVLGPIPSARAAHVVVAVLRIDKQRVPAEVAFPFGPAFDAAIRDPAAIEIAHRIAPRDAVADIGPGVSGSVDPKFIADHGGYIRVRDNRPRGTCFVIELPVNRQIST